MNLKNKEGIDMQIGAAYIRVSTEEQLEFSPHAQKHAILEFAKKNDILIEEQNIFIDEGISGRKAEKRPAFMNMIACSKKKPRPFDMILVHKFDRFARNREDSVVYKSLLRKECGIKVISVTEPMDDDKFSIILESMLEAMAEYYSLNLADEVRKGMFEKARRGEHIGKAPYGYDLKDKNLIKNTYESLIVQKIFDMYVNKQESLSFIIKYLNENQIVTKLCNKWRIYTLCYLLQNPVYIGFTRYNYRKNKHEINDEKDWIIVQGTHEKIISSELFQQAQKKLNSQISLGIKNEKSSSLKSWCQNLAVCSNCNYKLTISTCNQGKYPSFRCNFISCPVKKTCSCKFIEKTIIKQLDTFIKMPIEINLQDFSKEKTILQQHLKKLQEKKELIKNAYLAKADTLEEYKKNKEILIKEEEKILIKLNQISSSSQIDKLNFETYEQFFSSNLSIEEKNNMLKKLIKKIEINLETKKIERIEYA